MMNGLFVHKRGALISAIMFGLFTIYNAQGFFFTVGSMMSKAALFAYLGLCAYFLFIMVSKRVVPASVIFWTLFLILNITYFFFHGLLADVVEDDVNMIRSIVFFLFTFYPFFYLSKKGWITEWYLRIFFLAMLVVAIFNFWFGKELLTREFEVTNAVYPLVFLAPYCFFLELRLAAAFSIFILAFVIESGKRGALLSLLIYFSFFSAYVFWWYYSIKRHTVKAIVMGLGILGLFTYSVWKLYSSSEFMIWRFEIYRQQGAAGREYIWGELMDAWVGTEATLFNFLFGYGFNGSRYFAYGASAHNDFLEVASNFGLIGVLIFILIFFSLFRSLASTRLELRDKFALLTCLVMWLVDSQHNQWFNALSASVVIVLIAYLVGKANRAGGLPLNGKDCSGLPPLRYAG